MRSPEIDCNHDHLKQVNPYKMICEDCEMEFDQDHDDMEDR